MKKICIGVIMLSLLLLAGCGSNKAEGKKNEPHKTEIPTSDLQMSVVYGKIAELVNDNEILLEVTERTEDYNKGDKIYIKYQELHVWNSDNLEAGYKLGKVTLGDVIYIQYWPEEVQNKDGHNYIEVVGLEKDSK